MARFFFGSMGDYTGGRGMAMVILPVACNEAIGHYRELQDHKCLPNILYRFQSSMHRRLRRGLTCVLLCRHTVYRVNNFVYSEIIIWNKAMPIFKKYMQ
jgi:hypothetical protein